MAVKRDKGSDATGPAESVGTMMHDAVRAHERALELSHGWSEGILGTLKDQAESYGALLRSVDASVRAMEKAVTSQAEANRAMAESLEASRRIISTALRTQERSVEQVENLVGGLLNVLTGQLQALRTQVQTSQELLTGPVSTQSAMFLKMTQDWMDTYARLLAAAPTPFRREDG